MTEYPEHEKLKAVSDHSQAIGAFLEWLPTINVHLASQACPHGHEDPTTCEDSKWCRRGENDLTLWPSHHTVTRLLARYFEVDLDRLEAEKRDMLEALRSAS